MKSKTVLMVCFLVIIAVIICSVWIAVKTFAEEEEMTEYWVLCQPDSYVTIRSGPGKNYQGEGRAYAGDNFFSDGVKKGSYIHMVNVPNELGEGWISDKYLTVFEPEVYEESEIRTVNVKTLNCRTCIGGSRRGVLKKGAQVKVYLMSDDWSVTNKGYIQSKFLD